MNIRLPGFEPTLSIPLSEVAARVKAHSKVLNGTLGLSDLSRLLFSLGGTTGKVNGTILRTIPIAENIFPFEIYFIARNVEGVEKGFYRYRSVEPGEGSIEYLGERVSLEGYLREDFAEAISEAPLIILLAANSSRVREIRSKRREDYVYAEIGHMCQNISLEAAALGFSMVYSFKVESRRLASELKIPEEPYCVIGVGRGEGEKSISEENSRVRGVEYVIPSRFHFTELTLEECIWRRRSARRYVRRTLPLEKLAYILKYSLSFQNSGNRPYVPPLSKYFVKILVLARELEFLPRGKYIYDPSRHSLILLEEETLLEGLYSTSIPIDYIRHSAANLVLLAKRGKDENMLNVECGMVAQNIYLCAASTNLGTIIIGDVNKEEIKDIIGLPGLLPLYIMPIGLAR